MKRAAQAFLGLAVSAVALWLTLRGKDLGAVWEAVRAAEYRYLAVYAALFLAIHVVRTLRWSILLEPVARVPFWRVNAASAVGLMALMVLPFRLGELARPYLVADGRQLTTTAALSSIVVERVIDGLFTALLLVVALLGVPDGTPGIAVIRVAGTTMFLGFAAGCIFLVLAAKNRALAVRLLERVASPVSPRLGRRLAEMTDAFIDGLRLVPSRRKVALVLLFTALQWAMVGYELRVMGWAFGFDLSLVATYVLLGIVIVGIMIPAGPGFAGTFQGAILVGLSLFAPREAVDTRGVALANVLWAAQMGMQVGFGLFFLSSRHIDLARVLRPADAEP